MVFVVSHFTTPADYQEICKRYAAQLHDDDIVCCGTAEAGATPPLDPRLAYHPIFELHGEIELKDSHRYLDSMLRAIQIESPAAVVFDKATKYDTPNALKLIKEHCDIVDVRVID